MVILGFKSVPSYVFQWSLTYKFLSMSIIAHSTTLFQNYSVLILADSASAVFSMSEFAILSVIAYAAAPSPYCSVQILVDSAWAVFSMVGTAIIVTAQFNSASCLY